MADRWQALTLREAGVTLIDCDHRTPPPAATGYPYVAIPQLRSGRIDLNDARRITREHYVDWTRKAKPSANDVVLSRRCNPGETAFVPPNVEFALGQNLVLLRADGTKVFPPFLRWLVRGPEWWEQIGKFLNVGAVFDSLRCADVPNFELRIPPLPEQRAIAHILGTLDDKIELNRRINETLEAIARALFKSWFVDFDPVRAKAKSRDTGLPKHIADLFPDSFEDSELGEIPKGWSTSSVYDLAKYINGAAYRAFEPNEEHCGLPIIKIAELKAGVTSQTRFSAVDMPSKYKIDTGDILFSWSGNPDTSIDIFVWTHCPAWLNQHIFRVVPNGSYERAFVLMALRGLRSVFAEVARNKQTTGLGHVTVEDLKRLLTVRPPESVLPGWNKLIEPVLERSFGLEVESKTLATLRDTLLPKLISGELRVKTKYDLSVLPDSSDKSDRRVL
ncbi:MAG: restriction endonuclease subunit S [Nitrospiraceae bacterium]|nr:restriction endonuclease subunit S [Nitrospiraceae bacterium]